MNGHRSYTITLDQDPNMQSTDAAIIADNAAYPPSIAITIQKFFKKQMHLKKPVFLLQILMNGDSSELRFKNWRRIKNPPAIIQLFQNISSRKKFESALIHNQGSVTSTIFKQQTILLEVFWRRNGRRGTLRKNHLNLYKVYLMGWNDTIIIDNTYLLKKLVVILC